MSEKRKNKRSIKLGQDHRCRVPVPADVTPSELPFARMLVSGVGFGEGTKLETGSSVCFLLEM